MHRLADVHVLDVPLGHQPQRLVTVGSARLGDRLDRGYLPGSAGLAGQAALLDDGEQTVGGSSSPKNSRPPGDTARVTGSIPHARLTPVAHLGATSPGRQREKRDID
jgi:hypothetical protein